jgi:hypothetical protein
LPTQLKGAVFEDQRAQRLYRGGLVGGRGGGIARLGLDAAAVALLPVAPATRVYWPAPVLREVLGQRQNVDALRAWEGVWLGRPTAAGRGSAGRLSAASADVADRRPGGGGGVR